MRFGGLQADSKRHESHTVNGREVSAFVARAFSRCVGYAQTVANAAEAPMSVGASATPYRCWNRCPAHFYSEAREKHCAFFTVPLP